MVPYQDITWIAERTIRPYGYSLCRIRGSASAAETIHAKFDADGMCCSYEILISDSAGLFCVPVRADIITTSNEKRWVSEVQRAAARLVDAGWSALG